MWLAVNAASAKNFKQKFDNSATKNQKRVQPKVY